ncbi:unnamed protein product [Soboliphyme baturini]|uniref:Uncharacterized protein n=1 Tax=Soboliphyme baturini TaxID=241478 RepID=A0A183IKI1_9BILA|nr:unnamed protein product [Soboliphyme baturini]
MNCREARRRVNSGDGKNSGSPQLGPVSRATTRTSLFLFSWCCQLSDDIQNSHITALCGMDVAAKLTESS